MSVGLTEIEVRNLGQRIFQAQITSLVNSINILGGSNTSSISELF